MGPFSFKFEQWAASILPAKWLMQ